MIPEDTEAERYARKAPDPAPGHREGGPDGLAWPVGYGPGTRQEPHKRQPASTATAAAGDAGRGLMAS